jgi:AcrR family transcriptional regulator
MHTPPTNDKKGLKQQRVRSYFIQAAKDIILTEGVENVSVRKVAELAGYAFSTIYKHYKDLDALLQDVKASMIGDVVVYMRSVMPDRITGVSDMKTVNRAYAAYYLEHPHVFRFFYSYRLDPESAPPVELPDFASLWHMTYDTFVLNGTIKEADIPLIAKTIIYSLHGLIALYFAGYGMTDTALYAELDQMTDYLLGERK